MTMQQLKPKIQKSKPCDNFKEPLIEHAQMYTFRCLFPVYGFLLKSCGISFFLMCNDFESKNQDMGF